MDGIFSRQEMMFSKQTLNAKITILWTGFIGSNLAMTLAKTGFTNLFLVDFDIVKIHNLLNQWFLDSNLNQNKTDSLKSNIEKTLPQELKNNMRIMTLNMKVNEYLKDYGLYEGEIIIVSVDTVNARLEVLEYVKKNWKKRKLHKSLFIFVNTNNEVIYNGIFKNDYSSLNRMYKELQSFTKDNSSSGVCWEKSAFYLGSFISGLIVGKIREIYKNKINKYNTEIMYDIKKNYLYNNYKWFTK